MIESPALFFVLSSEFFDGFISDVELGALEEERNMTRTSSRRR
jgi:hypothetical protein